MKPLHFFAFILLLQSCQDSSRTGDRTGDLHGRPPSESPHLTTLPAPAPPPQISAPSFENLLDSLSLRGTILLFDETGDEYHSNDFDWAKTGQLPASTFKIANTIVGLETGVISGPEHLFPWDRQPRGLPAWEDDLTLPRAFATSCVPCYQEVTRNVGAAQMQATLEKIGYPAMTFDSNTIDQFWLRGPSRISPFQQIDFLRRFYHQQLPIEPTTYATLRRIMVREEQPSYTVSGKTGLSNENDYYNGWFVGFVEREGRVWFFATNVEPMEQSDREGFVEKRVEVTRLALKNYGVQLGD